MNCSYNYQYIDIPFIPHSKLIYFLFFSFFLLPSQLAFPFGAFVFVAAAAATGWPKVFGIKHSEQQPQQIDNSRNLLQGQSEHAGNEKLEFPFGNRHTEDLGNELAKTLGLTI